MNQQQSAGPMDMGDIVAGAWSIYRRTPARWLAVAAVAFTVVFAMQWLAAGKLELGDEPTEEQLRESAPWVGAVLVGTTIADLFSHVALVAGAIAVLSGGAFSVAGAYATGARRFLRVLLASIVTGVVGGALALTVIAIPLALFFFVNWSMASQVIVAEDERPLRALGRSRQIVRGNWWRVFGINLAILLIAFLPGFFLGRVTAPFGQEWLTAFGSAAGGALSAPFVAIAQTLLYRDLRVRKGERPFAPALREAV